MKVTKDSIIGDVLDYDAGTAKFFFEIVCTKTGIVILLDKNILTYTL